MVIRGSDVDQFIIANTGIPDKYGPDGAVSVARLDVHVDFVIGRREAVTALAAV
jgi:hypothetical protein